MYCKVRNENSIGGKKRNGQFKVRKKNYAVFLDEDLFNHRDYKLNNKKKFVSKLYFNEINNFFNFFEKKFKIKIIVCLHPRTHKIKTIIPFRI